MCGVVRSDVAAGEERLRRRGSGERNPGDRPAVHRLAGEDAAEDAVVGVGGLASRLGLGGEMVLVTGRRGRRVEEGREAEDREMGQPQQRHHEASRKGTGGAGRRSHVYEHERKETSRRGPCQPEPYSAPSSHGPQIANVAPGSFWMFTNSVSPSGLNVAPANSAYPTPLMLRAKSKMRPSAVSPRM